MHYFLSLSPSLSLCLSLSLQLQLMHAGMTKIAHGSVIILSYNWKDKSHMKPDHWLIDFPSLKLFQGAERTDQACVAPEG